MKAYEYYAEILPDGHLPVADFLHKELSAFIGDANLSTITDIMSLDLKESLFKMDRRSKISSEELASLKQELEVELSNITR